MPRLIDADAVLALLTRAIDQQEPAFPEKLARRALQDVQSAIEALPTIKPQVVANITGGLLQGATSDHPVDVYTLDFDYDGENPEGAIADPDGDEAWFGQTSAEVDPAWVQKILDAPNLAEEDAECVRCGNTLNDGSDQCVDCGDEMR